MRAVNVAPPYILVAHSYGGIVARTFIELFEEKVAGLVLIDTATPMMYEILHRFPRKEFDRVIAGIELFELNNLREECGFTDEEWDRMIDAVGRSFVGSKKEDTRESGKWLAEKKQFERNVMGEKSLVVIKCNFPGDQRLVFDEGVRRGNGSVEDRKKGEELVKGMEWFHDELVAAQLRLSTRNWYVVVEDCGHDWPIRRPDGVVKEVLRVLEELE